MKDLSSTVLAAANKQMSGDSPFIRLIELTVPTTPRSVIRLANYDRDVTFETESDGTPLTWQRCPMALGEFRETKTGDLSQVTLNIVNVTRELMEFIDQYEGLVGEHVRILTVNASGLLDVGAKVVFDGHIVAAEVDSDVAVFSIGQPNLNSQVCPARRFLTQCGVVTYGDAECQYPLAVSPTEAIGGGFSTCDRSLAACRIRGLDEAARGATVKHPFRFGGQPGIAAGNP